MLFGARPVPRRFANGPDSEFRLARTFYYLGLAFVAAGAIRPAPNLDLSDCFFLASLAAAAVGVVLGRARIHPAFPKAFIYGFMVFCLGAIFSLPVAFHPLDSAGALARFTYVTIVWFALGTVVLRSRRHVEVAVGAWILSIAISGLGAIAQVLLGPDIFGFFTTIPTVGTSGLPVTYVGRQIGLSGHPNDLGGAAAVGIAPAIFVAGFITGSKVTRYLFIGLLCLVVAGIALSGSVTAFGAAIVAAGILFATGRISARHLIVGGTTLVLASASLVIINQAGSSAVLSPVDRVFQTLDRTNPALATGLVRLDLDAIAWNEVARSPLYGVGLDPTSQSEALGGIGVHNMFLFSWVGAGIFGLLGLLIMVVSLAASYGEAYKRSASHDEGTLVLALAASFVSFLIVTLAQPVLFIRYGWVSAALLLPLRALQRRRDQDSQTQVLADQAVSLQTST